jgi:hypothetical protein
MHRATGAVIVGPTGGGRSSGMQACAYDGAKLGLRVAYLGHEITEPEFNARAANLARIRGDDVDDELRAGLARVRYLDLTTTIGHAWENPGGWIEGITASYDVVIFDPLSAVESVLPLNFEQSNTDFIKFYDRLVQPATSKGVAILLVDNVGHAIEAKSRAKGASAKSDRADLTFSCALVSSPPALIIKVHKVRSVRAAFRRGDEWTFLRDSQTIERRESADHDDDGFRPTVLMERVSEFVESESGATLNAIKRAVSGKREYVTAAIERLLSECFIERRSERQAQRHYSLRPYREADDQPRPDDRASVPNAGLGSGNMTEAHEIPLFTGDSTEAQPRPNRGPASVSTTEAPRPVYVVPGTRASVGDESDADAELERIAAKYGPPGANDRGEEMAF